MHTITTGEERVFEIEPITYRRKNIAHGVILGKRKYHWMLKKKYSPLFAVCEECFITEKQPKKKDFLVYIPEENIEIGKVVYIHKKEYEKPLVRTYLKILAKEINFVRTRVIREVIENDLREETQEPLNIDFHEDEVVF